MTILMTKRGLAVSRSCFSTVIGARTGHAPVVMAESTVSSASTSGGTMGIGRHCTHATQFRERWSTAAPLWFSCLHNHGQETAMSKFLRKAAVAERYGIDKRSVDRWAADGRLPAPLYRGRVPLWDLDELDARDRQATIERASRKSVSEAELTT
jgi:hypothetical protein